jgi:ribosome-associated protein
VPDDIREVALRDESIRLGQLLKLAGLADTGSDVKLLLEEGLVTVDGEVEARRGRQLRSGAVVTVQGESVRVVAGHGTAEPGAPSKAPAEPPA